MSFPDLDVLKDIPGYQAILKAVLKSQIQLLVEQLSNQTGEESVILTASVTDGTLCHLGSESGKYFINDHEDFKSQFLGFCLRRHHKRKSSESVEKNSMSQMSGGPKRFKESDNFSHSPSPLQRKKTPVKRHPSQTPNSIEQEHNTEHNMVSEVGLNNQLDNTINQMTHGGDHQSEMAVIKTEPNEDDDGELEITGIEIGNMSETSQLEFNQNQWQPDASGDTGLGYGTSTSGAEMGDQSDYANNYANLVRASTYLQHQPQQHAEPTFKDSHYTLMPDATENPGLYSGTTPFTEAGTSITTMESGSSPGIQLHKCEQCGKFFQKAQLLIHMRKHTGERPYKCEVCNATFTQTSSRNLHMRKIHSVKQFKCQICQTAFIEVAELKQHMTDKHRNANNNN